MTTLRLLTLCALDQNGSKPFMAAFQRVLATKDTPARTGYWLGKIHKVCAAEAEAFDEVRTKRVRELGQPIEGQPNQMHVPADKLADLIAEISAMDRDIDLGIPEGLKLALPPVFTPEDWMPLMSSLDIFEEPPAK